MTLLRVTEQSRQANHLRYVTTAQQKLERVREELATNRKISQASDDPAGAALALRHRDGIEFEAQMRRNLENGVAFMNVTEAAMEGATEAFHRIRELTVQASSDTLSTQERQAIAEEVDEITRHLVQIGNTNFGGSYIFSGHQTKTPAYSITGDPPTAITYDGDAGARVRRISQQDTVAVNVTGDAVFGTVFSDLIALRTDLESGASGQALSPYLTSLDTAVDRVLQARADVGSRVNRFDAATRQSEETDTNLQQLRAEIEEPDLTTAIVNMQQQATQLEAALGAIARTMDMSLLNFLR